MCWKFNFNLPVCKDGNGKGMERDCTMEEFYYCVYATNSASSISTNIW
jgi:hypothetical protein